MRDFMYVELFLSRDSCAFEDWVPDDFIWHGLLTLDLKKMSWIKNGRLFANTIVKWIFLKQNICIFFIEIPLPSARKGPDDNNYAFKSGNEWQATEQIFKGCCLQQRSHIQLYPPS